MAYQRISARRHALTAIKALQVSNAQESQTFLHRATAAAGEWLKTIDDPVKRNTATIHIGRAIVNAYAQQVIDWAVDEHDRKNELIKHRKEK